MLNKIGKCIIEVCTSGLIVGGAILIYENIFIKGYQIGGILQNAKEARKAVKNHG